MLRELNLLPPGRRSFLKKQLILVVINRFMGVLILSWTIFAGIGVVCVMILQGLIFSSDNSVQAELEKNIEKYQKVREEINKVNDTIRVMHSFGDDRIVWSDYFQDLFAVLPPDIRIDRMTGTSVDTRRLEFSGVASTRSSLIVLEDRFAGFNWVKQVIAPRSNLIQRDNPEFRFDFIIKDAVSSQPPQI